MFRQKSSTSPTSVSSTWAASAVFLLNPEHFILQFFSFLRTAPVEISSLKPCPLRRAELFPSAARNWHTLFEAQVLCCWTTNIRSGYGWCICHVNHHTQSKATCPPSHGNDSEPPSMHLRLAPPFRSTSEDLKTQPNHTKSSLCRARIR